MFCPQIPYSKGEQYAAQVNAIFTETSALEATNVEELFVQISEWVLKDFCLFSVVIILLSQVESYLQMQEVIA